MPISARWLLCSLLLAAATLCAVVALATDAQAQPESHITAPKVAETAEVTAKIDTELAKCWQAEGVTPARQSSDEEFLRRVYFDVAGVPPTPAEATAFLDDKVKDKRAKLIDKLLADPRFGRHLADEWVAVLMGRGGRNRGSAHDLMAVWLAGHFNNNRNFGHTVYDIIAASGKMSDNLAGAYWATRREQRVADFAGLASRHFTGVQIQCAQCHTHPYEKWTMEDFAGVAGFFQPVQIRLNNDQIPFDPNIVDQRVRRRPAREGDTPPRPEDMRFYDPRFLGGERLNIEDSTLWRSAFAKWVVSSDNTQTHRYLVNRFWSFMFGSAFVNPVDDFNSVNKPLHPELFEYLAADFARSGYDVKRFYRIVLNSRAYQLASTGASRKEGAIEPWTFAQYPVRRLTPEQLFGGIVTVAADGQIERDFRRQTGNPFTALRTRFGRGDDNMGGENRRERTFNSKANAVFEKAIDEMTDVWFLRRRLASAYSAQSSDDEMTDSDGFSLTIDQALMIMNGTATQTLTAYNRGSCLHTVMTENSSTDARIKALFLRVLSRQPTATESRRFSDFVIAEVRSRRAEDVYADVLMALLMTTEFATNH